MYAWDVCDQIKLDDNQIENYYSIALRVCWCNALTIP